MPISYVYDQTQSKYRVTLELDVQEDFYDPLHTTPQGSAKIGKLIAELFLKYVEK